MTDNPWKDIPRPSNRGELSTRRVDPDLPWGFFWGRGFHNKLLFVLQHDGPEIEQGKIPNLRGVDIFDEPDGDSGHRVLILRLDSLENRDIFAHLCRDIVEFVSEVENQKQAVDLALKRTWKWHHLLRGGTGQRLSMEQQKGLLAELFFLKGTAVPAIGLASAIRGWKGPYDSPKDFEFGSTCVEVKSKRATNSGAVKISSVEQLDTTGLDRLFLHVRDIDNVEVGTAGSCNLSGIVEGLISDCKKVAPEVIAELETALLAAGYTYDEDYSQDNWQVGAVYEFVVDERFPRIVPTDVVVGVGSVIYTVDLTHCDHCAVRDSGIEIFLREGK